MAVWPWCREPGRRGVDPNDFPNVRDWCDRVAERPAVKRAMKVLSKKSVRPTKHGDEAWSSMFGDDQFDRKKTCPRLGREYFLDAMQCFLTLQPFRRLKQWQGGMALCGCCPSCSLCPVEPSPRPYSG